MAHKVKVLSFLAEKSKKQERRKKQECIMTFMFNT